MLHKKLAVTSTKSITNVVTVVLWNYLEITYTMCYGISVAKG
jgi:hypothetical protein